jgi:hypothetical protein
MINWLYILNGIVVEIVQMEPGITPNTVQFGGTFDTLTADHSQTFKIGDAFTDELQLQYNHEIWTSMAWLTAPVTGASGAAEYCNLMPHLYII